MTGQLAQSAAEELAMVGQTRARSVRDTQMPVWADALCSALMASAWALVMTRRLVPLILGVVLFIVGVLVHARATRRKGRVLDDHATKANAQRYFLFMAPLILGAALLGHHMSVWVLCVSAGIAWIAMFAYLRADARYQTQRLVQGDFRPWDMV